RKAQLVGKPHQAAQRHSGERQGEPLAHPVEVDVVAVIARRHGDAGEPAFGGFAGEHQRQSPAAGEVELGRQAHDRFATANRGSNNHWISERRSNTMSADKTMPGCSGMTSPYASISSRARDTRIRNTGSLISSPGIEISVGPSTVVEMA